MNWKQEAGVLLKYRSLWLYAGIVLHLAAGFVLVSLFVGPSVSIWMQFVEWFNPNVDAPDNWALMLTYAFKSWVVLFVAGCLVLAVAFYRMVTYIEAEPTSPGDVLKAAPEK